MKEIEEDEKNSKMNAQKKNDINENKKETKLYSNGVLDKLRIFKSENVSNNILQKTNIALIKSSYDYEIEELIKKITGTEIVKII